MNTTPVIQRSCLLYCKLEAGSLLKRMTLQGCSFQHVEPEAVWRSFPVTGEDAFLFGCGPSSSAIGDLCEDKIVKSGYCCYCFSLVLQGAPPDVWLCDSRFWRQMLPMLDCSTYFKTPPKWHLKKGYDASTCQNDRRHTKMVVPVDMPNKAVSINMPKECPSMCQNDGVRRHAKRMFLSAMRKRRPPMPKSRLERKKRVNSKIVII